MRVSLDGGETWHETNDHVILDIPLQSDDMPDGSMTIKFTEEGMIADLWADSETGECEETLGLPYDELKEFFFGDEL